MKEKNILFILLSISIFSNYEIKNNKVYYNGRLAGNSDAKSFKFLGYGYSQDKTNIYLNGEKLEGVDVQHLKYVKKLKRL